MPVHRPGSAQPSSVAISRSSRCRALPTDVVSRERRRICSPVSASSRDSSRTAAVPGLGLGGAHDHVGPVAEPQLAAVPGRPGPHVLDHRPDPGQRVRPHQEHVGRLRGHLAGRLGQAAEVERGTAALGPQPRRVQGQVHELAVEVDRLAVEQIPQHGHGLQRAPVTRARLQLLPGQVGGDDVDREPAVQHLVQGGDLPGQLRAHISPIRTATSSCIRRSSGAIPAAKLTESMPRVYPDGSSRLS